MKLSALLEPMVAAGIDAATILQTVKAWEEQQTDALERRRANDRDRQERRRHVTSRDVTVTVSSRAGATRGDDKTSTQRIEPQENKQTRAARDDEFEQWYREYPNKVQRGAAERAWPKARSLASLADLLAGLQRYKAAKPPDRQWQNPATWLNGKGWLDLPGQVAQPQQRAGPAARTGVGGIFDELDRRMGNGQGHGSGDDKAPSGVVLSLPHRAAQ